MSRPNPSVSELRIPLSGRQMIRHPPKSALTPRRGKKNAIFDPSTVETQANNYDIVNPGGNAGELILTDTNPGLLAIRRKADASRPKTAIQCAREKKQKREYDIISPRGFTSLLTKRPQTAIRDSTRRVMETITREVNTEKMSLAFQEDPIAYFSKRKDGRGHRFIYLNQVGDRANDPFFNPYELTKVPFAEVNPDYFTMSANGITHIMANGSTEHIPIDRWSTESSMFSSIRKLKLFAQFFFWKPFRIWKNFVMRQRFGQLTGSVLTHPFFTYPGFYETQLQIMEIHVEGDMRVEDMMQKYLLSFIPQKKFEIKVYRAEIERNKETLNQLYSDYIAKIQGEVLGLDARIRDPKVLQVKDSDFSEMKRRNPNLAQLMLLEKKKAEKRVELTKKVNNQIIALGFFIRDIDYMLLETLAASVYNCWHLAADSIAQDMSAVFQVEVSYSEDGKVLLSPTLPELLEEIHNSLQDAITTTAGLPRLLNAVQLRAHIRESHPDYRRLFDDGPRLRQMIEKDDDLQRTEQKIVDVVTSSYRDAVKASQVFAEFFSIYQIGKNWKVDTYISTRSGQPVQIRLDQDDKKEEARHEDAQMVFQDLDFANEPIVDMKRVRQDIDLFKNDDLRLQQFRPTSSRGALYINSKKIRSILNPIPMNTLDTISKTLRQLLIEKVERIQNALIYYGKQLKVEPSRLEQFVGFCELIVKTAKMTPTIKEEINFIDDLYRLFDEFCLNMDIAEQNQNALVPQMQLFITAQQFAAQTKQSNIEKFISQLKDLTKKLEGKLQKYMDMATAQPGSIAEAEPERLKSDLDQIRGKVEKIKPEINECKRYQSVLEVDYCQFTGYNDVVDTIDFHENLYAAVNLWKEVEQTAMKVPFESIDIELFASNITTLKEKVDQLNTMSRIPTPLLIELTEKVDSVFPYLSQIRSLCSAKMQPRHWQALFDEAKLPNSYHPEIRLDELINLGIFAQKDRIQEQAAVARGEFQLEEEFQQVLSRWSDVQLPVVETQVKSEDSLLLGDVQTMIMDIEDSVMSLGRMAALPFVLGVRDQIVKLQLQLESVALILEAWQLFQRNWLICGTLFSHEDSKNSLQSQSSKFTWVRRRWIGIVRHATKDLSLLAVCSFPNLLEMMKENNMTLESILSSLGVFVDSKRAAVPRLFALGNADVLSLISCTDISSVRKLVVRLFMNMTNLEISEAEVANSETQRVPRSKVLGMFMSDGDMIMFGRQVIISGGIEHWLPSLVDSLKLAFMESTLSSIPKIKSPVIGDWVLTIPCHAIFITLYTAFCAQIDECFEQFVVNIRVFSAYETELRKMYLDLAALLETQITPLEAFKAGLALSIVSNQIEITKYLGEDKERRYWWNQTPKMRFDASAQRLTIVTGDEITEFGWEMWGLIRPFVMTPASIRVLHNVPLDKCPLILGSEGTGRSQSVEYLAAYHGKFLYQAPAFPDFTESLISRIFAGVVSMGAWALFSDVQKLPFSAVSYLHDCLHEYTDGINNNALRITVNGKPVDLNPTVRIFFTANAKPEGLPPQFMAKVKPIALSAPERRVIIETRLAAHGFKAAKKVAVKVDIVVGTIVNTYAQALRTTSIFAHINPIIAQAGKNVRETKNPGFSRTFVSDSDSEEFTIARAIYFHFAPSLHKTELDTIAKIIYGSIRLFDSADVLKQTIEHSGCFSEEVEINSLAAECTKATTQNMPSEYIVDRALSLFNILQSRRCAIVHGPPNSGKTSVLDVLQKASEALISEGATFKLIKKIRIERIFQGSDSWERLFGELLADTATGSIWAHGLLSAVLNALAAHGDDVMPVLVFDGPLDPKFQQLLAAILSMDLSYSNSLDTIDFTRLRIIVETDSVGQLSPELIPYCGLLCMSNVQETYDSLCEFSSAELLLHRVIEDSSLLMKVLPTFEEVLRVVVKYVYHRENCACYSGGAKHMQNGSLVITDHLPTLVATILNGMINRGNVDPSNEDQLKLGLCYACFVAYSPILTEAQVNQFDSWLRSSFHIELPVDWKDFNVPNHFAEVYPKPCFKSHRVINGQLVPLDTALLDMKTFNAAGSQVFVESIIVPNAYFVPLSDVMTKLMKLEQNILLTGECGKKSFLRFFFLSDSFYDPVFIPTCETTTSESIYRFLEIHTILTQKFASKPKKTVLIFEDVRAGNTEVLELIRQLLSISQISLSSSGDPHYYEKIDIKNFTVIVTTNEFTDLPSRFVSLFAPLVYPKVSSDTVIYSLDQTMRACDVKNDFAQKALELIRGMILNINGFPANLPFCQRLISAICRMKEKNCSNEENTTTLTKTLISEINTFMLKNNQDLIKAFREIGSELLEDEEVVSLLSTRDALFYPEFSTSNDGTLNVTAASHPKHLVKEELEFYLQVYNNSSSEKIVLKFFPIVIDQWSDFHRAVTAPGGCALLVGPKGTGRFTLTRFVAHMSEYDFINITDKSSLSLMARTEHMHAVLRDIVTNCALLHKKSMLFIRHQGKTITHELRIVLDFLNSKNFTQFFSKAALDEFYQKFSSGQAVRPDQKLDVFEKIQQILRTNFHVAVAMDTGAVPLTEFNAIEVDFSGFGPKEFIQAVESSVDTPVYQNILGNYKDHVPQIMEHIHQIVARSVGYVHVNYFHDFLDKFCEIVTSDYQVLVTHSRNLISGINFTAGLEEELQKVDRKLDQIMPTLQRLTTDCDALQISFTSKKEAIEVRRKHIEQDLEEKTNAVDIAKRELNELQKETNDLLPLVIDSQRQIEQLQINDIETIRINAAEPNAALKLMLEVLCIFLGYPVSYDRGGYKLLMDNNFVQILLTKIRYQNVSPAMVQQIQSYFDDPNFTKEGMESVAPALENLFDWISAICKYTVAKEQLQTKSIEVEEKNRAYQEAVEESKLEQQSIKQVEESLEEEVKALETTTASKKVTEEEYEAVSGRKQNIEAVLKDMDPLIEKWQAESAAITTQREVVLGDCLFYAFYLSYCGLTSGETRMEMMREVIKELRTCGFSNTFTNPIEFMNDRFIKTNFAEGLYQAEHAFVYNAFVDLCHIRSTMRVPLVVDPDGLIDFFFTKGRKQKNMVVASQKTRSLDMILSSAMAEGKTLLLFDVDELHPYLAPVLALMRLPDKQNVSKDLRIGTKMTTWDPKFKLILFTNHNTVTEVPPDLLLRVTPVDVSASSFATVKTILDNSFIEFFDNTLLSRIAEIQRMGIDCRVAVETHEREILETISDVMSTKAKDPAFDFLTDEATMRDVAQCKELYFTSLKRMETYEQSKSEITVSTGSYASVIDHLMRVWEAISRYLVRLSPFNKFNYSAFVTVVNNSLQMPGVIRGTLNSDQQQNLQNMIMQQVLNWIQPTLSFRDSIVLMFVICFLRDVSKGKCKLSDLDVILNHISEEANSSIDMSSGDLGVGDPLEHMKFTNIRNVFYYFSRYVSDPFGIEFASSIPFFQVENIISASAVTPTIIMSSPIHNPSQMIGQFIAMKTRGDNFEPISVYDDPEQLKSLVKTVTTAMSRGTRVLLHIPRPSADIGATISEIYLGMVSTSLHTNFRLIISVHSCEFLSHRILLMARRLRYSDFPSVRHQMLQIFHHQSTTIKSSMNPKAIKKIAFAAALCFSLLHYRQILTPHGFNSCFNVPNAMFRDFMETIRPMIDSASGPVPIKTIRDYLQDAILGSTVVDPFDRRRIRAIVFSIFGTDLLSEDFAFCRDFPDSDRWIVPHDIPLSTFPNHCMKMQSFPNTDCLLMFRSCCSCIRDWNLSRWVTKGLSRLVPRPQKARDLDVLSARLEGYLMSIPDPIVTTVFTKHPGPMMSVLKGEIDALNELISEMKVKLVSMSASPEAEEFVNGTVPLKWREAIEFDVTTSPARFLTFVTEKREFLTKIASSGTFDVIDVRLFGNIKGLLFAYQTEKAEETTADGVTIEFTPLAPGAVPPWNCLTLRGMSLISGTLENGTLVVNRSSKTVTAFPDVCCRVTKPTPRSGRAFQCPLFRSLWIDEKVSRPSLRRFVDGQSTNLQWYLQFPTESTQVELISNGTCLVCAMPGQFAQ